MSTIYVLVAPTVLLLALLAMLVAVSRRHRRILPKLPIDRRRRTANTRLHTLQQSGRYWGVRIDSHCRATSPLVGREYAFDSAPHLPYQGCNAAVCSCSYVGLAERRSLVDRRTGHVTLSFGVSGKLRHSDMIMYDRQTESWWQQALGEGIVGAHMGDTLSALPSWMESWDEYRARNPDGLVMDQPKASRPYGRNPYVGYDGSFRPFLYSGENPPHDILPLSRVVRVGDRAWPLERLRTSGELREGGVVISWVAGQASALDTARIADGRDVGSIRVRDGAGRDLAHDVMFAFAFHAFYPGGIWMLGE